MRRPFADGGTRYGNKGASCLSPNTFDTEFHLNEDE